MKITLDENRLILEPNTSDGVALFRDFISEYENWMFQLQVEDGVAMLTKIGDRPTVCNEAINILYSSSNKEIQCISNLGHTPFEMDNRRYESVEGFWQGLKFEEEKREELASLFGKEAKKAGGAIQYKRYIRYNNDKIRVGSKQHWDLMQRACENKFRQNHAAQSALLNTGIRPLYHKPRKDSEVIPGAILAGIWMNLRKELRKEKGMESLHLNLLK
jgi:hypothetical protein